MQAFSTCLVMLLWAWLARATHFSLYAHNINMKEPEQFLAEIEYDVVTKSSEVKLTKDLGLLNFANDELYCIYSVFAGTDNEKNCFALKQLSKPLKYELQVYLNDDSTIQHMSLVNNPNVEGIVINSIAPGTINPPAAIPLKKITRTYQQQREFAKSVNGEAVSKNDLEEDDRPFYVKNWRIIVIGLLLYHLITSQFNKSKSSQENEENAASYEKAD